jgi:hypothetical protein
MPLKSTHLIIFHLKSTHYKIIPLFSTHLQKRLLSESLFRVKCFSDLTTQARNYTCAPLFTTHSLHHSHHAHKLEITLAHLSSPPTRHITLTTPRGFSHPHNITPGNSSNSYYTDNTVPSRKDTSDTMGTKKAPRKESERLQKKSSVATLAAAAKRDPAITVPSPHQRKGQTTTLLPLLPCAI